MAGRRSEFLPLGWAAALCAAALIAALPQCGGSTVAGGSAGSGGTSATQGGAGQGGVGQGGVGQGGVPQGCATTMIEAPESPPCTSDADCPGPAPYDDHCGEVVPGGYRTCLNDAVIQTTCSHFPAGDECGCNGLTCPSGTRCVLYQNPMHCGGTGGSGERNVCRTGCTPGGCPSGQACIRGLQPAIGVCYAATCRTDQDCGGCSRCAPYWIYPPDICSPVLQGLRCTCRTDSDCKPGLHCATGSGGAGGTQGYCF